MTGVASLQPAREFPVDGAAGEGFTNTGDALAMSPALFTKYLDAGKRVAKHAVLLPDGLRLSAFTTRQDWTNEVLAEIRGIYGAYSDSNASSQVKLQGLVWDTKQGGRLPVEKYLAATLAEREAINSGKKVLEAVAKEHGLSSKYLGIVWQTLNGREPSQLLDDLRARWRQARPEDAAAMAVEISRWQNALWKFNSVGHLGKMGGPKAWMTPIDLLIAKHDARVKIPAGQTDDVRLCLIAAAAGDGNEHDFIVWQQPRFVAAGKQDILLKDIRGTTHELAALRAELFADTDKYLLAVDESTSADGKPDLPELAKKHALEPAALAAWLDYLGMGSGSAKIEGHFTKKLPSHPVYKSIHGWGLSETPLVVANSGDELIRIPGNMKPHSVAVHPSPKLSAVVGWQSPIAGKVRINAKVVHAHPECGDGVSFALELRHGTNRRRLASGIAQGAKEPKIEPVEVSVKEGDLISIVIGPRDGHACDLTAVDLTITLGDKSWDLAKDVSGDLLAGNPHADRLGNKGVWHFYSEPASGTGAAGFEVPAGSLLDRWLAAKTTEEKNRLSAEVQKFLRAEPTDKTTPDATMYRQLASLNGPLLGPAAWLESPLASRHSYLAPGLGYRLGAVRSASARRRQGGFVEPLREGACDGRNSRAGRSCCWIRLRHNRRSACRCSRTGERAVAGTDIETRGHAVFATGHSDPGRRDWRRPQATHRCP